MRRRLDVELVRRGLASSRARAAAAVEERQVLVSGALAEKASRLVGPDEPIEIRVRPRFVSRGGQKLEAALDRFAVDVEGRRAVDLGASTGGFTDCLLQRGAAHVVAVDVGRGQLDWSLRQDPRVTVVEGVNAREVLPDDVGGRAGLVTADLSFISLRLVAGAIAALVEADGDVVVLVKPQFEAGRADVGRGGIVRDPAVHRRALAGAVAAFTEVGLVPVGLIASPVRGASGNIEFLAHFRHHGEAVELEPAVEAAVAEAHKEVQP